MWQGTRGKARRGNPAPKAPARRASKGKGTSKLKKSPVGGPGTSSWVQSREDQVKEILDEKQKEARSARATDLERRQKLLSEMRQQQAALEGASNVAAPEANDAAPPTEGAATPTQKLARTESMVMQSYWRQKEEDRAAKAQAKAKKAQLIAKRRVEVEAEMAKRSRSRAWQGSQKVLGPGKSTSREGKSGKVARRQQVIVGVRITGQPAVAGKSYRPPRRNVPSTQRVKSKGAWKNISKAGSAASFYGFAAVLLFAAYALAKSGSQLVDTSKYKEYTVPSAAPAPAPAPVVQAEEAAPAEAAAAAVDAPALNTEATGGDAGEPSME